jgi:hypothetical protein
VETTVKNVLDRPFRPNFQFNSPGIGAQKNRLDSRLIWIAYPI